APQPVAAVAPQPAPVADAPSLPAPVPPGMVRVHIVGEGRGADELVLQRDTGGAMAVGPGGVATASSWSSVCNAPCGTTLDTTSGAYYVNRASDGPGLRSKPFTFGAHSGDVTLRVRTGSKAAFISGFMLAPLGFGAAAAGAVILPYGVKHHDGHNIAIGAATLSAGLVAAILGIALVVRGRNRVRMVPGRPD
ncbi:MAG: hypothetical protein K1X88_36455, partial [Nannocystaceae bacterium]|nr:hypothetical protein [Nannocystaceae bacterium]